VQNVAILLGLPAEEFATVEAQLARRRELDDGLRAWIAKRTADECLHEMKLRDVVSARIYSMADIVEDRTYREREDIITITDADLGPVRMQGVVPKMAHHGGGVWRTGPALGEDNELVYRDYLGLTADKYESLKEAGTI
jgi:crotonobetainyl-CoA:carnitine CoA-transferase CaiB-like acyl-CoA transferase